MTWKGLSTGIQSGFTPYPKPHGPAKLDKIFSNQSPAINSGGAFSGLTQERGIQIRKTPHGIPASHHRARTQIPIKFPKWNTRGTGFRLIRRPKNCLSGGPTSYDQNNVRPQGLVSRLYGEHMIRGV